MEILETYNIERMISKNKDINMKQYQDRDWLEQKYLREELSTVQIGKICGVYTTTIRNWIHKVGIKIRTNSESKKLSHRCPEMLKKVSETSKKQWANPKHRRKLIESLKIAHNRPEVKKRHSESNKITQNRPEVRKRQGERMKKQWANPEFRERMTGKNNPNYGNGDKIRGEKNGRWQGGLSFEPWGIEFNDNLKALVRERDSFACQLCKIRENGKAHDCHHSDYDKRNNIPENLITLCKSCHAKTNTDRKYWQAFFNQSKEQRAVLAQLSFAF